jgi:hypothetical protein
MYIDVPTLLTSLTHDDTGRKVLKQLSEQIEGTGLTLDVEKKHNSYNKASTHSF